MPYFFQCIAVDGKRKTMLRLKGKTHRCKCPDYQSLSSLVFVVLSFSFPIYRVLKAKSTSPSQYYNPCHGYVINSWEWKDIQFPDKLNPLLMYHFDSLWSWCLEPADAARKDCSRALSRCRFGALRKRFPDVHVLQLVPQRVNWHQLTIWRVVFSLHNMFFCTIISIRCFF